MSNYRVHYFDLEGNRLENIGRTDLESLDDARREAAKIFVELNSGTEKEWLGFIQVQDEIGATLAELHFPCPTPAGVTGRFTEDPDLKAFTECLEEMADLDAGVDYYLQLNDMDELAALITDMRALGRRLRDAKMALAMRAVH